MLFKFVTTLEDGFESAHVEAAFDFFPFFAMAREAAGGEKRLYFQGKELFS